MTRIQKTCRLFVYWCCAVHGVGCEKSSTQDAQAPPPENTMTSAESPTSQNGSDALNCAPFQEVCNELDDDCDGRVDELIDLRLLVYDDPNNCGVCGLRCEVPRGRADCVAGVCVITGCEDGYSNPNGQYNDGCEARCMPSANGIEVCDGADNDCDGVVDEDYDLRADTAHCGGCNQRCVAPPNALIKCGDGRCEIDGCEPEWYDLNGVRADGCEYQCARRSTDTVREFCNGLDDDCDGLADEAPDLEMPNIACASEGVCAPQCTTQADCSHEETCHEEGACIPRRGGPQNTLCSEDAECTSRHPSFVCIARNYRRAGEWIRGGWCQPNPFGPYCAGEMGFQCPLGAGDGNQNESGRCDGLDNDCDGRIDEDFSTELYLDGSGQDPRPCFKGFGLCRAEGYLRCAADGGGTVCDAQPTAPESSVDDQCDGLDQDCDGLVDEGFSDVWVILGDFAIYGYEASRPGARESSGSLAHLRACSRAGVRPWSNLSWQEAASACAAAEARLCTAEEWAYACGGENGSTFGYGADFDAMICNHAVGAEEPTSIQPTGADPLCESNGIFDLHGNVKEWINDRDGNARALRGGAFNTPIESGLSCLQEGDWKDRNFRNPVIGFRCCRDEGL